MPNDTIFSNQCSDVYSDMYMLQIHHKYESTYRVVADMEYVTTYHFFY